MTIIYFILILGIVVLIHEGGHFLFAKRAGIYVYEFSIGMGPRIFKFNRKKKVRDAKGNITKVPDETEYSIRLFPIGGYVQMAGEEIEADEKIPVEKRMQSKTWMQRFLTIIAGVTFNFILAIVLLFIVGLVNGVTLDSTKVTDVNSNIYSSLEDGDYIKKIDGKKVNNYDKLVLELQVQNAKEFMMTVEHSDGTIEDISVAPILVGESGLVKDIDYGFKVDGLTIKDSSIDGLSVNSTIEAVSGVEVDNYSDLLNYINRVGLEQFELTIKNDNNEINNVIITPTKDSDDVTKAYAYGFYIDGTKEHGIVAAIKFAFCKFISTIEQMIFIIWYLITGVLSLKLLSGPVGIYSAVGTAASGGLISLISLLSLISINVGFLNLLPFPAFDGGRALFLLIERIKGSPVNPKIENIIHTIGFALLMILMLYITYNDILKLF